MNRLKRHGVWWYNKLRCGKNSHVGRCEDWAGNIPQLQLPEDSLCKAVEFDQKLYIVVIRDREDWRDGDLSEISDSVVCSTDGSKTIDGTSCGGLIVDRRNGNSRQLMQFSRIMGKYATVFQAALHALHRTVQYLLQKEVQEADIVIFSDSKSVLQSLSKFTTDSSLILECYQDLNRLGSTNRIKLHWIPAHSGFWGNEKADELARNAWIKDDEGNHVYRTLGCEPYLPIPSSVKKRAILEWERANHRRRWLGAKNSKHARDILKEPLDDKLSISFLNRKSARVLTYLYTGHGPWREHLFRQRIVQSPTCAKCGQENESASHVIDTCISYYHQRFLTWGVYINDGETLMKTATKQELVDFIMSTGRLK